MAVLLNCTTQTIFSTSRTDWTTCKIRTYQSQSRCSKCSTVALSFVNNRGSQHMQQKIADFCTKYQWSEFGQAGLFGSWNLPRWCDHLNTDFKNCMSVGYAQCRSFSPSIYFDNWLPKNIRTYNIYRHILQCSLCTSHAALHIARCSSTILWRIQHGIECSSLQMAMCCGRNSTQTMHIVQPVGSETVGWLSEYQA